MWWQGLPGLDQRYAAPSRAWADRLTALACAARLHPWDSSAGAYGSPDTTRTADILLSWLERAEGERAAWSARIALCIACTDIPPGGINLGQLKHAANEIAKYLSKGERT